MPLQPSVNWSHGPLRVSENKRFLVHDDGTPFFYLGDTVWELFHRLSREEAERYLCDRAAKRFTVIQAVLLAELNGLTTPNAYGQLPLHDLDPTRPNEDYFAHVDWVVERAEALGLCMGLLPTWGSWVVEEKHGFLEDHRIFSPANAYAYGAFLGRRYGARRNVLWILGGDRYPEGYETVWRAMARGLAVGGCGEEDYSGMVISYHPRGPGSSAPALHGEAWLSLDMNQSGHAQRNLPNYEMVTAAYGLTPAKPVLDGEPRYENLPAGFTPEGERFTDYDVRQAAYWALLAGACGHTYGCNDIWQCYGPGRAPVIWADTYWYDALRFPGSGQMAHVRRLIESRPFLSRISDDALVVAGQGDGPSHVQAGRDVDGSYAFVYIAQASQTVEIDLERLSGSHITAWLYDPRSGAPTFLGSFPRRGTWRFTTPAWGPDWVLVLDDAARAFPAPGAARE